MHSDVVDAWGTRVVKLLDCRNMITVVERHVLDSIVAEPVWRSRAVAFTVSKS